MAEPPLDQARVEDSMPTLSLILPALGLVVLALTWGKYDLGGPALIAVAVLLVASVLAAVLHAETIAHRVGEPAGSLVLAVAVTVIEVGLILTIMLAGKEGSETIARDTVLSAIMICCNFIAGLSILLAALRDDLATFRPEGPTSALAAVATAVSVVTTDVAEDRQLIDALSSVILNPMKSMPVLPRTVVS